LEPEDDDEEEQERQAQVGLLRTRVQEALGTFKQGNQDVAALSALAGLVQACDLFKVERAKLQKQAAAAAAAPAPAAQNIEQQQKLEAQVAALTRQLADRDAAAKKYKAQAKKLGAQLGVLGDKQMALAEQNMNMEASIGKLKASKAKINAALIDKASEMQVFEQGMKQLNDMLKAEVEAKHEMEEALEDITTLQSKMKLSVLPLKAVKKCMLCNSGFSMFGSKASTYCRHCGRIFCKACTGTCALPEFGFGATKKVRVCKPCLEFRAKCASE
jgi:chromosome segregation ATPase